MFSVSHPKRGAIEVYQSPLQQKESVSLRNISQTLAYLVEVDTEGMRDGIDICQVQWLA